MPARFCIPPDGAEQAHLVQLRRGDEVFLRRAEVGELVEGQAHVFQNRHGPEERAALVHDPELPEQAEAVFALGRHDVLAADENPARGGPVEADDVLQERALAAPGAAQDDEHLPLAHVEAHVPLDHLVAVGDRHVLDGDHHRLCAHTWST
jgi:hypothetical protein